MCFKNSLVAESISQNYSGINRMQKLLTHIEPMLPLGPSFKGVSKGNIGPVWVDHTMKNIINVIKAGMIDLRDKTFLKIIIRHCCFFTLITSSLCYAEYNWLQ